MRQTNLSILFSLYAVLLLLYAIFSYSLTDPNLVLSGWDPYWAFQTWMWRTFFDNPHLLSYVFAGLVVVLFGAFSWFLFDSPTRKSLEFVPTKKTLIIYLLIISPLIFSYNALSHDVFNYMFNAKMVAVFHADPHQKVALDYAYDDWLRFMHNTHTPAPYGYGWTAFSLLPYFSGFNKFLSIWWMFRLVEVVAIYLLYVALQWLSKQVQGRSLTVKELLPLFLNPLFLIEVVSNMHNDLWMLIPAMLAVALAAMPTQGRNVLAKWSGVILLLAFSISIKYATIALLPIFLVIIVGRILIEKVLMARIPIAARWPQLGEKLTGWVDRLWLRFTPQIASVLLFLPLLVPRSQLFHPWYLLWPLVWLPLIKHSAWRNLLLWFSLTSLLRYIPWLYEGGFSEHTVLHQQLITFSALFLLFFSNRKNRSKIARKYT